MSALTTAVAACGTQAAGQPAGPPAATATASPARTATASPQATGTASWRPPSPPPTLTGPVTLTSSDNGATVRLHVGQQVAVALASMGLFSWHVPAAMGTAVTRVSASGGYPGQQPARATFLAVRPGHATLTAVDDTACLHAQPACEPAQQEWRVTVIITSGGHPDSLAGFRPPRSGQTAASRTEQVADHAGGGPATLIYRAE